MNYMQGAGTSAAFEQAESDALRRGNTYTLSGAVVCVCRRGEIVR